MIDTVEEAKAKWTIKRLTPELPFTINTSFIDTLNFYKCICSI